MLEGKQDNTGLFCELFHIHTLEKDKRLADQSATVAINVAL